MNDAPDRYAIRIDLNGRSLRIVTNYASKQDAITDALQWNQFLRRARLSVQPDAESTDDTPKPWRPRNQTT